MAILTFCVCLIIGALLAMMAVDHQRHWVSKYFTPARPKEGDHIRITWLPNPKNHPYVKSCYIGFTGKVKNMDEDGNFELEGETSVLIVHAEGGYKFEKISE